MSSVLARLWSGVKWQETEQSLVLIPQHGVERANFSMYPSAGFVLGLTFQAISEVFSFCEVSVPPLRALVLCICVCSVHTFSLENETMMRRTIWTTNWNIEEEVGVETMETIPGFGAEKELEALI